MAQNENVPKRPHGKRERKLPTIASINALIAEKEKNIKTIQVELESLTARLNALYLAEFTSLGLLDLVADPEMAALLALKVKEINGKPN